MLPSDDSDHAAFRETVLWFHTQEYPRRIRYPSYIGIGRSVRFSEVKQGKDLADGVHEAHILGDERSYVYKGVDRLIYFPHDTDALEQELRNLELFRGNKSIVQLVAAVVSINPYQTSEHDASKPPVLRGVLLEHHPNGTLANALQSPNSWMTGRCRQWGLEIAMAVDCLYQNGVTHMDLKPKNIVMSKDWHAILIDISGVGVTIEWLIPELLEASDEYSKGWKVRVRSDTWALGKILSSMAEALRHDNERLLLIDIAQDVERTGGCIPLSEITHRFSQNLSTASSNR